MAKTPRGLRFEEAMQKLETLVGQIESGEIGVEESIAKYEEAMALQLHCQQFLDQAEQRIRKIQLDSAGRISSSAIEQQPADDDPADSAADERDEA